VDFINFIDIVTVVSIICHCTTYYWAIYYTFVRVCVAWKHVFSLPVRKFHIVALATQLAKLWWLYSRMLRDLYLLIILNTATPAHDANLIGKVRAALKKIWKGCIIGCFCFTTTMQIAGWKSKITSYSKTNLSFGEMLDQKQFTCRDYVEKWQNMMCISRGYQC